MRSKNRHRSKPFRNIFDDPEHPWFSYTNHFLAAMTLISVAAVALETMAVLETYAYIFLIVEYAAVIIFSLEYLARIKLADKPLAYIFSFFGVVDLMAILPSVLGLSNLTFLKAARFVRIIRLLRMLRLTKFSKIKRRKNAAQSLYKINLEIYLVTLTSVILILGSMFYIFEHEQAAAKDIPSGMYWTLRIILGGISYPQPETVGGIVTLILTRFTSMILLGMMLSLVGTMLRKILTGSEKDS